MILNGKAVWNGLWPAPYPQGHGALKGQDPGAIMPNPNIIVKATELVGPEKPPMGYLTWDKDLGVPRLDLPSTDVPDVPTWRFHGGRERVIPSDVARSLSRLYGKFIQNLTVEVASQEEANADSVFDVAIEAARPQQQRGRQAARA